jgi:recombination protein RecA
MAKKQKDVLEEAFNLDEGPIVDNDDDVAKSLIKELNKVMGSRVAFNLSTDEAPTKIKRWLSMGSKQLDYVVSNRKGGGLPEGRIIEISGQPSIGKSHIAYHLARNVQQQGGLVVYVDTENAIPLERLAELGVDVSKRFVYCDTHCTEEVFSIIESTITKAKSLLSKDVPILVIWDSVAATSPKQELDGEYDKDTMGLQARVIAKGMRKIVGVIGQNNVTLVIINQLKSKVGMVMGDPFFTPGGAAIPFHASVRIRLTGGKQIKDKDDLPIGIHVNATIIKNKVARPFRRAEFEIHFGRGIVEHEQLFDLLRERSAKDPIIVDGVIYGFEGTGAWKSFTMSNAKTGEVILEKKFTKNGFAEVLVDPQYKEHLDRALEATLIIQNVGVAAEEEPEDEG